MGIMAFQAIYKGPITTQQMCAEMVAADSRIAQRNALLKAHRHDVLMALEN